MKIHTKKLALALAITGICFSPLASATIINDGYIGSDDHGWGDRIGNHGGAGNYTFEIHNMSVTMAGNMLTVQINTNYAGHTGLYGTGYGDLFLSDNWTPNGSAVLGYHTDDHINGTKWTYGLSLDGDAYNINNSLNKTGSTRFTSNAGGAASLYELTSATNNDNAYLSDEMTTSTFRNGQEVVVDRNSRTTADTGTDGSWAISAVDADDFIKFEIDLTGTGLANSNTLAFHWGMTCGNDTIEGALVRAPEPAILGMIGIGLLGLGISRRKKA